MDAVAINYLAVIAGAVSNMVIGGFWYSPLLFGKTWAALMGFNMPEKNAEMKKAANKSYAINMVGALAMSYVMAHITGALAGSMSEALQGAFWVWLGFIAPVTLGSVIWEGKPWKLYFINVGYYLVALMVMAAILFAWK